MRRILYAAVLVCCFACSGHAQEPAPPPALHKVDGLELSPNLTVPANELAIVEAKCEGPVRFEVLPSGDFKASAVIEAKRVILAAPPAGQAVMVLAVGVIDGEPTAFARCYVVSAEKAGDRPQAKQEPAPKPLPGGKLHVTVVADNVPWLESPSLKKSLADAGHQLHALKPAAPEVEARKLSRFVTEAGGAPALVVQDWGGKVLLKQRLPASEAELLKLITGK